MLTRYSAYINDGGGCCRWSAAAKMPAAARRLGQGLTLHGADSLALPGCHWSCPGWAVDWGIAVLLGAQEDYLTPDSLIGASCRCLASPCSWSLLRSWSKVGVKLGCCCSPVYGAYA